MSKNITTNLTLPIENMMFKNFKMNRLLSQPSIYTDRSHNFLSIFPICIFSDPKMRTVCDETHTNPWHKRFLLILGDDQMSYIETVPATSSQCAALVHTRACFSEVVCKTPQLTSLEVRISVSQGQPYGLTHTQDPLSSLIGSSTR